jgi:hypothetical protein
MSKRKPEWDECAPLTSAVADAIATADVEGASYEDLARAAVRAYFDASRKIEASFLHRIGNNDQEDDGA